jgi:hypothetical protein
MRVEKFGLVVAAALWSISCSTGNTLEPDDLRSQVKQGIAFASEEKLFVDRVLEERISQNFARGHLKYLLREVHDAAQQAHGAVPQKAIAPQFEQYQTQMDRLEYSLAGLRLTDRSALLNTRSEIQEIQLALQHTREAL